MATILIVDDQPHFREMFHEEIKDEGYSVMSVSNVASAKGYIIAKKMDVATERTTKTLVI